MNNEQETSEYEIEPVEIHPEQYATNLFGEVTAKENLGEKSGHAPAGTSEDFSEKFSRAPFNVFSLTDAIGSRNKREAWMLYHKAIASGMVPDELFYKVVWQVKTMLIASRTRSAEEADMKTYPYNKAKGFLRNYKPGELEKMSENLIKNYHELRRGNGEMETLVEKNLLSL